MANKDITNDTEVAVDSSIGGSELIPMVEGSGANRVWKKTTPEGLADYAVKWSNLKGLAPAYTDNTAYAQGQVVGHSGKLYYVATDVPKSNTTPPTPGTTWFLLSEHVPDASTTTKGRIEISTPTEADSGSSNVLAMTPSLTKRRIEAQPRDRGDWVASTSYIVGDTVENSSEIYRCNTAHTSSSSFSTDSANWDKTSHVKPTVSAILTVTSSWQEVEDGFSNDDVVEISTEGAYSSEANNIAMTSITQKFSDVSTSSRWLGIRSNAGGARIEIRRNGDAIEARTQGSTANTKAWTVKY